MQKLKGVFMNNNGEFTPKQKRFCEEYLVDFNATQAAIRAKYSKKTAYSIGYENINGTCISSSGADLLNSHKYLLYKAIRIQ